MPDKFYGFRKATEKEDLEEGTDFFCDGLRFDLTEDFNGKDHLMGIEFQIELDLPWALIKLGIRTGNSHGDFAEPVVVIGIIAYSYDSAKSAVNQLSFHWSDISSQAFDLWCNYNDYVDEMSA